MDTDSLYMALSAPELEQVVKPEFRAEFEACKKEWLAWDTWSNRTPGIFKLEATGSKMIALCSKCYYMEGDVKNKTSSKGMSAKHNALTWGRYKRTLEGFCDRAENTGFRMVDGVQAKLGLSAYYDKRLVLTDGVHTEPLEYHL